MLSEAERRRIEQAVRQAETKTTGEIYCVVAAESSAYREVPLAWAGAAALLAPAILLAGGVHVTAPELMGDGWTAAQMASAAEQAARSALGGAILLQGALFVAVALFTGLPGVRRFATPRPLKRERVRRRARELFLSKNLAATRERTGLLIYVSVAEHMAELVTDDGISGKVQPAAWDDAMELLIAGLRQQQPAEGFEQAIARCAEILSEHFPVSPGDNPNELPDAVVILG